MALDGNRVPFLGPQGIFKPRILTDAPLSVTTSPNSPYADALVGDDMILYKYRGDNPEHHENVGLRRAYKEAIPLVYFRGLIPGKYFAAWPVFVVADNPAALTFTLQADELQSAVYAMPRSSISGVNSDGAAPRRAYVTAQVQRRLHQQSFRERVLDAYREQCAICRLRHPELLDAAHIIGDKEEMGEPLVENGLSLCKLHHAAFDKNFFGIRPDRIVEVRASILAESDGPMLQHGLKEIHGIQISVPAIAALRPHPERLDVRYRIFLSA
jgi:putative restriction endonuclease